MMKVSDMTSGKGSAWLRRVRWLVLVAALAVGYAASAHADAARRPACRRRTA